ncbi:MAG: tetraacyldisaccharide 4'-kinase [Betaproteobacteria bacterium]|nr:tetraacyldisaccharide 4'-kinase [Betaproteobacteria bacterium]
MTLRIDRSRSRLSATIEALWYGGSQGLGTRLLSVLLLPWSIPTALISRHRRQQIRRAKRERRELRERREGSGDQSLVGSVAAIENPLSRPVHAPPAAGQQGPNPADPPIVIVGNLLAGGTGKTPVVIAIARALQARGWQTGLLARGVGAASHQAQAFLAPPNYQRAGDEAVLMARNAACPIATGRDRSQALQTLLAAAPATQVVISDDGLQHRGLHRDLELILFDDRGLGNGRLLPAGPLREAATNGLEADAVLLRDQAKDPIGHPRNFRVLTQVLGWWALDAPDRLIRDAELVHWTEGHRTLAISGIARPERFFDRLLALGLTFDAIALADHAPIDQAWLAGLPADCILMTEKDAVKCEQSADPRIRVLRIETVIPSSLIDFIEERLCGRPTA